MTATSVIQQRFLQQFPQYEATSTLDELRRREFQRLERGRHVYLDYTGASLYAESQVRRQADLLLGSVLGNSHSSNPTSATTTELVERCRSRVLEFFNASPHEYDLVFTGNASQALKLVGESYPFEPGDEFLLTFDNHNSVNGIREFDRARGARTRYVPLAPPDLRVDEQQLDHMLTEASPGRHHLFAYPAQSNFSGVQHPLGWIDRAHDLGWHVLLDAAAFVPTNRLDLSLDHPDWVALSFYKMFGHPTGVGALIGRRTAMEQLHRPWFAGGTISVASVQADRHVLNPGARAFEDGTLDFTNIPAVEIGLDLIESVGIDTIHTRVTCLTGWLLERLLSLVHSNGEPLIKLYGPPDTTARGGTVTVNFHDRDGILLDHEQIEQQANRHSISLRTGCFCNPGAGELAMGLERQELVDCFEQSSCAMSYQDLRRCIDGKSTGAVRISLGWVSNLDDVEALIAFASELRQ